MRIACPNKSGVLYKELLKLNNNDEDLTTYAHDVITELQDLGLMSLKRYKKPNGEFVYTIPKTITEKSLAENVKGKDTIYEIDKAKYNQLKDIVNKQNISFINPVISKSGDAIFVNITSVKNNKIDRLDFFLGDEALYEQELAEDRELTINRIQEEIKNKPGVQLDLFEQQFDKDLAKKIQDKLQKLYPEIKLNITNNPIWEQGDNIFNQDLLNSESKSNIFKLTENIRKANRLFDILSVKNKMSILTTANIIIENNPLKYLHVSNTGIVTLNIQLLSKDIRKELGNDIIPEKILKEASDWSKNINDTTDIEKQFVKYKEQIENEKLYYESLLKDLSNLDTKSSSELFNILVNTSIYFKSSDVYQSFSLKGKDGNIFTYEYKNGKPRKENEYDNFILLKKISQGKRGTVINHEAFNNEDLEIEANLALQEFKKDKERIKKAINKLLIENIEHSLERTKSNLNSETFKSDYIRNAIEQRYEQVQMNEEDIIIWGIEDLVIRNLVANGIINQHNELSKPFGFKADRLLELKQNKEYQEIKDKQKKINYILNNKEKFNNEYDNFETDDSDLLAPIPEWFLNAVSVANTGKYFNEHKGFIAGMIKGVIYLDAQKQYDDLYDNGLTPYFQILASAKNINDLIVNKINFVNTFNLSNDLAILNQKDKNKIIGQANIKAMTVLVDAINQKQDTLPHEYAHHYIAWFRNTPIVQEAIKKWGSEEALVQSIGEQAVKQKGEAWNWWKKFVNWLLGDFKKLSKLDKEKLTKILTDAFLTKIDLETGKQNISIKKSKELALKSSGIFNQEINIKPGVAELFESNPELANSVYEALGYETIPVGWEKGKTLYDKAKSVKIDFKSGITTLPNGNYLVRAYRTDNTDLGSKGFGQRGEGLYLSLTNPYPGRNVNTVEFEIAPSDIITYKEEFSGTIPYEKLTEGKGNFQDRVALAGGKAFIGGINSSEDPNLEIVLYDKTLINKALQSKKKVSNFTTKYLLYDLITPQQKQQAQQLYSQYLDTIGVTDIAYHHSESDLENFRTFPEGYFSQALKKKGTHYEKADDVVFFVKKPLTEEFMSQRKFKSTWGLKVPNMLKFNAGEKINEGVHPGIDEGVKAAINGNYDAVDFGRIRDNKTWSEVIAITNPNNAVKLGSKQNIEGFKEFVEKTPTQTTDNFNQEDTQIINNLINEGEIKTKCN